MWIALGAFSFCSQYYLLRDIAPDFFVLGFVFFATILTYTFQRFEKIRTGSVALGERMDWMRARPQFVLWSMYISAAITLFFGVSLSFEALMVIAASAFLSFFYARRIPVGQKSNLRDVPHIKIYLIAIAWSLTTVFLPALASGHELTEMHLFLFAGNFLFILGITIPFDIRDIHFDEDNKKTIPQVLGVFRSKLLALLFVCGSGFIIGFYWPEFRIAIGISTAVTSFLIIGSKNKRNDLYFSFFIDGLLVLQPLLLWGWDILTSK